jgi:G3E family GTPase
VDRIFAADAHRRHAADIHAEAFVIDAAATWSGIAGWADFAREFFGAGLLRCKGLLALAGDSRPVLLQGVQTVFSAPTLLDAWPSADRRSRLVCISQGLDPTVLRATLKLLHAQPGTYRPASVRDLMEHA